MIRIIIFIVCILVLTVLTIFQNHITNLRIENAQISLQKELDNCEAHLKRTHVQLFDCRDELAEIFEHHKCDDKQLIDCQNKLENKCSVYEYIVNELKIKDNRQKKKNSVISGILPAVL